MSQGLPRVTPGSSHAGRSLARMTENRRNLQRLAPIDERHHPADAADLSLALLERDLDRGTVARAGFLERRKSALHPHGSAEIGKASEAHLTCLEVAVHAAHHGECTVCGVHRRLLAGFE